MKNVKKALFYYSYLEISSNTTKLSLVETYLTSIFQPSMRPIESGSYIEYVSRSYLSVSSVVSEMLYIFGLN